MLLNFFSTTALAAWDGSGDLSGNPNAGAASGGFVLQNADENDIYGYRFTVYDEQGNQLGYGIDILFKTYPELVTSVKFSLDKKSHIDLYRDYLAFVGPDGIPFTDDDGKEDGVSLGQLKAMQISASDQPAYGLYYDDTLPTVPTELENWLTEEDRANQIAQKCEVDDYAGSSQSYIVCEPLFAAYIEYEWWTATLAEYAVYQSTQYGWTSVPDKSTNGYYSQIMRPLSGYFGRYLYAEEPYSGAFETEPVSPEEKPEAFRNDSEGMPSILLGAHTAYNTAANITMG